MDNTQTLMGLHWIDAPNGTDGLNATILFYSPMPGLATPGFNSMTRDTTGSWVAQGRLGRDPAFQWTGSGEETIVIEGRLYPNLFGGLKTMDRLRAATKGQRFVFTKYRKSGSTGGAGTFEQDVIPGPWGVRRLRQGDIKINSAGIPTVVEFSCELVMIGADPGEGGGGEFLFAKLSGAAGSAP